MKTRLINALIICAICIGYLLGAVIHGDTPYSRGKWYQEPCMHIGLSD